MDSLETTHKSLSVRKGSLAGGSGRKGWSCSIEANRRIAPFGEWFQQQKSASRGQSEAGIDKKLSSRAQQLAGVPEQKFNKMIAEGFRAKRKKGSTAVTNFGGPLNRKRRPDGHSRLAGRTLAIESRIFALALI